MTATSRNVLFICSGNSARSILAEGLLDALGSSRFKAFSAGSHPKGAVHPLALETLRTLRLSDQGFSSKSWGEFAKDGAPPMDFVITVCDQAAGEMCPVWPVNRSRRTGVCPTRRRWEAVRKTRSGRSWTRP